MPGITNMQAFSMVSVDGLATTGGTPHATPNGGAQVSSSERFARAESERVSTLVASLMASGKRYSFFPPTAPPLKDDVPEEPAGLLPQQPPEPTR